MADLETVVTEVNDDHEVVGDGDATGTVQCQVLRQVLEGLRRQVVQADAVVARVRAEDVVARDSDALRTQELAPTRALAEADEARRERSRRRRRRRR